MLGTLLILASAQTHVFDLYDDAQLCDVLGRNLAKLPDAVPPVVSTKMNAHCESKQMRAQLSLDLNGEPFDRYIENFLVTARAGVCNMSNPTMKTFAKRGWRFAYTFTSSDGRVEKRILNC